MNFVNDYINITTALEEQNAFRKQTETVSESEFQRRTGKDFNKYYSVTYPKLLWYVNNIVKDQFEAEDIVNKAFMKSLSKIDKFDPKYQFSTLLYTIAKNMAKQHLKDKMDTLSMDHVTDDGQSFYDTLSEKIDTRQEEDVRTNMKYKVMLSYIETLEPKYRDVIVMREIKKMAYRSIAEALNINLSTIKSQIRQARHILMKKVEKEFKDIDSMY